MKSPMLTRDALQKASLVRGTPDWSPTHLIAEEFLAAQDREALARTVHRAMLHASPGEGRTRAEARAVIDALLGDG